MTRKTTILAIFALAMAGGMSGAGPAQAFCIDNKSPHALRVHVETSNPFGKFAVLFEPGDTACCSWFDQRCNPTRVRNGILAFSVRTKQKAENNLYCAAGWTKRVYGTADGTIVITETQQTFFKRNRGMPPPIVVPPPPEG